MLCNTFALHAKKLIFESRAEIFVTEISQKLIVCKWIGGGCKRTPQEGDACRQDLAIDLHGTFAPLSNSGT